MKDEYIRKEDAKSVTWEQPSYTDPLNILTEVRDRIESIKPADVAPVVRCRDCEHYYFADNRIPQEQRYVCEISGEIWKPDDFCSYGKMREE